MNTNEHIITRFPPSPTGPFHVGSARTALFNYLFALQKGGAMVFRFEDTDKARSKKEWEENAKESLDWLGITNYIGPLRQSERTPVYREYLEKMIENDFAYVSQEEPQEGNAEADRRTEVIRFKNPNRTITFTDLIRGEITVDTADLGDFVIAKSLDEPLYHLAVVVDDHESGVTHVIRGEDHISNTPRQILIQEAIGAKRPLYAHLPLLLGHDRSKLSKRHGAQSVNDFRAAGFLPEAVVNYLALLGWHPEGDREIFTFEELLSSFDLARVQKGGAIFSMEKMRWVNKEHIKLLSDEKLLEHVLEFLPEGITILPSYSREQLMRVLPVIRERIETFADVRKMAEEGELEFYFERPDFFAQQLLWKEESTESAATHLSAAAEKLEGIDETTFDSETVKNALWDYASEQGRGAVLWPLRFALSGRERSPDPFTLAQILGKKETLARIKIALDKLKAI